jgi:hypothetical protein
MATTNQYEALLRRHWEEFRPRELAAMQDPETFFRRLGTQTEEAIEAAEESLEETLEPETDYQARVGQLQQIAATAREQVLREMLPPAEDEDDQAASMSPEAAELAAIRRELENL